MNWWIIELETQKSYIVAVCKPAFIQILIIYSSPIRTLKSIKKYKLINQFLLLVSIKTCFNRKEKKSEKIYPGIWLTRSYLSIHTYMHTLHLKFSYIVQKTFISIHRKYQSVSTGNPLPCESSAEISLLLRSWPRI